MGQNVNEGPPDSRWVSVDIEWNITEYKRIAFRNYISVIDLFAGLLELKQQEKLSGSGVRIVTNKCSSCLNMPYVQR